MDKRKQRAAGAARPKPRAARKRAVPGKAGYHHGDLPRALIEAAEQRIASEGPAQLTLRQVARDAGVSVAAPYRHFADRETLLAAVLAKGFRELARSTEAARVAAGSPLAALSRVGIAYVRFAIAHPSIYRLMFGPECDKAAHPDLRAAGDEAFGVLLKSVTACHRAGELGGGPQAVALASWSLFHGFASLQVDGALAQVLPVGAAENAARSVIGLLLKGAAPGRKRTAQKKARR